MGFLSFHTPISMGHENVTDIGLLGSWKTDWTRLRYLPNERVWFLDVFTNGYAIVISGDNERPDPVRLSVARVVVAGLPKLMRHVIEYLDAHLDYTQLGSTGQWNLEEIDFSQNRSDPAEVFEVSLTTDEYGDWNDCESWYVTCATGGTNVAPRFEVRSHRGGWYGYHLSRTGAVASSGPEMK